MKTTYIKIILIIILLFTLSDIFPAQWKTYSSRDYYRITDSIIEDINNDNIDEIIISYYEKGNKFVDIYNTADDKLNLIDQIKVPYYTVFFDVGDIDNNKKNDIIFLSSDGLYYKQISSKIDEKHEIIQVKSVKSEIVVPQPELLTDVEMVIDLNGDGQNELIIENIRAVEIYETKNFTKLAAIDMETILEYALIPGQFYPHLIFYTLPIIQVKDIDNDKNMEIITKFPSSINIYSHEGLTLWKLRNKFHIGSDNIYFLSNAYLKFAFPVIEDTDNDNIKEIVVSSANLDMPRLRFEAIGDLYYLDKKYFKLNKNKKIIVKGIPLNLPKFYNISNKKYKDFILPSVPFNLISIFGLLSGSGSLKVPFIYYKQDSTTFDLKSPEKLFDIPVRIENITSFVEELPFDQYEAGAFPDFYYFIHDLKNKTVDIMYYCYGEKNKYISDKIETLNIPTYNFELPATLKLGRLTKNKRKDVVYMTHKNIFILTRK